jgi:hypothetical protein
MLLHLAEMRAAGNSGKMAQEDQEQRPAAKWSKGRFAAVGLQESYFTGLVADLPGHGLVS